MHPLYTQADAWTSKIIGAAIEVHKLKGPGLLEPLYEKFMLRECLIQKIPVVQQLKTAIEYKGHTFDDTLRLDLLVDDCLIVELKAVEAIIPIHRAQLFSYMKLLNKPIGLIINFHEVLLKNGIERMILPGANQ